MSDIELTITIPVHNEQDIMLENTLKLINYLLELNVNFEIIIVDNGSSDNTPIIGRLLEEHFKGTVRFFSIGQKGVGEAFKLAVTRARSEYIINLDMDLSSDLSFIPLAKELLKDYSIVVGSKKLGLQKRPLIRRIGSNVYIFLARKLLKITQTDFSIGSKGYRRSFVLKNLEHIDRYTHYVISLCYQASKKGFPVIEVPVACNDFRISKFCLIREGI